MCETSQQWDMSYPANERGTWISRPGAKLGRQVRDTKYLASLYQSTNESRNLCRTSLQSIPTHFLAGSQETSLTPNTNVTHMSGTTRSITTVLHSLILPRHGSVFMNQKCTPSYHNTQRSASRCIPTNRIPAGQGQFPSV